VSAWLSSLAASIRDGQALEKNVDLFEQGFDRYGASVPLASLSDLVLSLSATFLRNHIIGALRGSSESTSAAKIDNGFVYAHPTISGMASVIVSFINPDSGTAASDPTDDIRAMIAEYSQDLPQVAPLNTPQPERQVVLITGSTRGLGSQLLSSLITDDKVERVYALNRPLREQTSLARHEQTFRDRYAPRRRCVSMVSSFFTGIWTRPCSLLQNWYYSRGRRATNTSVFPSSRTRR
jgi:hypothetical protein